MATVLVVEDQTFNQILIIRYLENMDATCHIAANGLEALKKLEDYHYQYKLILMDLQMPVMDGVECTKYIRQKNIPIPIVGLTVIDAPLDHAICLETGMDQVIMKPITQKKLMKLFDQYNIPRKTHIKKLRLPTNLTETIHTCKIESDIAPKVHISHDIFDDDNDNDNDIS